MLEHDRIGMSEGIDFNPIQDQLFQGCSLKSVVHILR